MRRISALAGSEIVVGVSPSLGLAWLERDRDIGLPAEGGADGPEINPCQRLVGTDALTETGLGIHHLEVIVPHAVAEAGNGTGDTFPFLHGAQIFQRLAIH